MELTKANTRVFLVNIRQTLSNRSITYLSAFDRWGESLKKVVVGSIMPNVFRIKWEVHGCMRARFNTWELQCIYSVLGQACLIVARQPLKIPAIQGGSSKDYPIQLLSESLNRLKHERLWSTMGSTVIDMVGTHARKSSRISFECGSTYRIWRHNCPILDEKQYFVEYR